MAKEPQLGGLIGAVVEDTVGAEVMVTWTVGGGPQVDRLVRVLRLPRLLRRDPVLPR